MKAIRVFLTTLIFFVFLTSCAVFKKSIDGIYEIKIQEGSKVDFNTNNILPEKAAKFVEYYQSSLIVAWQNEEGETIKHGEVTVIYLNKGYILTSFNLNESPLDHRGYFLKSKFFFRNQEAKIIDNDPFGILILLRVFEPDSVKADENSIPQFLLKSLKPPKMKFELNTKIFEKVYFTNTNQDLAPTYFIRESKIMAFTPTTGFFVLEKMINNRNFGSLVFNKKGGCIGIIFSRMKDTGEALVIPAVYIRDFLNGRFKEIFDD